MNKIVKLMLFSFILFSSFFFSIKIVSANSINKIDMDVYLDQNGNATVVEVWNADLSQGTEGYRPYTGLGNSSISNFSVSDDSDKIYESLPSWNINASFNDKAYKCGIHNVSNGVELCWGISKYGNRTYTLKYNISNFVTQYTDTQGIYFDFLNLNQNVGSAKIIIHSDIPFSLENARIWAFGNSGSINFENGSIVLESGGLLSASQYMVALIRFESNLFNVTTKVNASFDSVYDSAFNDVTDSSYVNKDSNKSNSYFNSVLIFLIIKLFGYFLIPIVLLFIVLIFYGKIKNSKSMNSSETSGMLNFGEVGKELPSFNEIEYWRDIPCNKDLEKAYWVCLKYDVVSEYVLKKGIIGAIILKWIRSEYVTVNKTEKKLFNFKDNNYAINFSKMTRADNEIESGLFAMMLAAANSNRVLEANEFLKWSKKNYRQITSWFSSLSYKEQKLLEEEGLIVNKIKEYKGLFGKKWNDIFRDVSPKLKEEAIKLKGLKKFLLDFSRMYEKKYFDVHLWEEYLIFAQLLGIADKVEEQFSKIYPNFNQETLLNTDVSTVVARSMADICYEGVQAGIVRAASQTSSGSGSSRDYSGSSTFSGGGGSSFSSGGSSAGGSSGGGFR